MLSGSMSIGAITTARPSSIAVRGLRKCETINIIISEEMVLGSIASMRRPQMFSDQVDIGAASRLTTISWMRADSIGTQMIRDITRDLMIRMMEELAGGLKEHGMRRMITASRDIAGGLRSQIVREITGGRKTTPMCGMIAAIRNIAGIRLSVDTFKMIAGELRTPGMRSR
jgi:hypothetical protein